MKTHRVKKAKAPEYPTRRQFSECARMAGIMAIGSSAWFGLSAPAQEGRRTAGVPPMPRDRNVPGGAVVQPGGGGDAGVFSPETIRRIRALAGKLGAADGQERAAAGKELIALGSAVQETNGKRVFPHRAAVLMEMKKLEGNSDPEIATRAREISEAVHTATGVPTSPPPVEPRIMGEIAMPGP